MIIIGFGYEHGVGKDTAVKFALNHLRMNHPNIKCERMSVGDKIRDLAYSLFDWAGLEDCAYYLNKPEMKDQTLSTIGKTPREIFIDLGQKLHEINEKCLIELCLKTCSADVVFWPDVYRKIDLEYIRRFHGKYVRISRPGCEFTTVTQIQDCVPDVHISNGGTQKDFNQSIKRMLDGWIKDGLI